MGAERQSSTGKAVPQSAVLERLRRLARACSLAAVPLLLTPGIRAAQPPTALVPASQVSPSQTAATLANGAPAAVKAQPAPQTPAALPERPATEILYADGHLTIHARNATLAEILGKVSTLTGVPIEIPDGASGEAIPELTLGPGPVRTILASLLSGAHFDYILQGADDKSDKLQSVLIMPRKKGPGEVGGVEAAGAPVRSSAAMTPPALAEAAAPPPEQPIPNNSASPKLPETSSAEASNANAANPIASADAGASASQPERDNSGAFRPAQPPVPATLNPQSITQQLTQMYQQRMQMIQQQPRPAAPPPQ